jgi:hypothetical protein
MTDPIDLTPKQREFIARACAFIDSGPPGEELDRLFTLAALQLPEPVVEMLRRRVTSRPAGEEPPARSLH